MSVVYRRRQVIIRGKSAAVRMREHNPRVASSDETPLRRDRRRRPLVPGRRGRI